MADPSLEFIRRNLQDIQVEQRLQRMRYDIIEQRFSTLEARLGGIEERLAAIESGFEVGFDLLENKLDALIAKLS
jgi:hypothetical protein